MEEIAVKKADNDQVNIEMPKGQIKTSVRQFVEFLLREGDIDNTHTRASEAAMQEGTRIHKMIQGRKPANYKAEVPVKMSWDMGEYSFLLEGRADGIILEQGALLVDEIKGTYSDIHRLKGPKEVHLAQARCYGYMLAKQENLSQVTLQITYCNMDTEQIRYFKQEETLQQLEEWFQGLLKEYQKWIDNEWQWRKCRQASLEQLEFPFAYRKGQKELVTYVYQTIYHQKKLFLQAPTGVGKTISTVFPALKAIGKGMGNKLFYLTAKTITRQVVENTLEELRGKGLQWKSITLTAKDKICFLEKPECNPQTCPYAKGHYNRINQALYDMLTHEVLYNRAMIEHYARKHQVCPFEFALDMSLFSDSIVCDYNYLFDPHVYLKRFFADGGSRDYLFLIDEAHNLVDRGREMYSARLVKESFLLQKTFVSEYVSEELKKHRKIKENQDITLEVTEVSPEANKKGKRKIKGTLGGTVFLKKGYAEKLIYHLQQCNSTMLKMKRECESRLTVLQELDGLVNKLMGLHRVYSDYLEETEEEPLPIRDALLDFYFEISHFLDIYERLDKHYISYSMIDDREEFFVKLFCVNPSKNLMECMARGRSTILFSATFLPIQYYKELLGGQEQDYEVYAESVFDPQRLGLYVGRDVTTMYKKRTEDNYQLLAQYIYRAMRAKQGKYMVFCPSYAFQQQVKERLICILRANAAEALMPAIQEASNTEAIEYLGNTVLLEQTEDMTEEHRERFLEIFQSGQYQSVIGFGILGGIFGEGIDLRGESLIGAFIIGTGLPLVCPERELLRGYFDSHERNGFDYAYRFPGMNKVLQGAGRVIRTEQDKGTVFLLDQRFLQPEYVRLFPKEWKSRNVLCVDNVEQSIDDFWKR